ncbi:LOW QUALITY PROTEIN: hypothetical protein PHMEG_00024917 [Phytophthora megakarya]|uniref:Uncharacterized protein n=1 Tax=Phytophthora megakarya TaxID=4795 RepID=A0A225VDH5_9STRA|nr:LOW QUALITY PROTEIN: hypothetical protein PHMEG_00024917 [Phytophthora megakarya]
MGREAKVLISELQTRTILKDKNKYSDEYHNEYGDGDDEGTGEYLVDYYSQGEKPSEERVRDYEVGDLSAANDNERWEAANGAFSRRAKRPQQNGPPQVGFNPNGPGYNNGNGSREDVDSSVPNMTHLEHMEARTIPRTIVLDTTDCPNECMTSANAKLLDKCSPTTENGLIPTGQPQSAEPVNDVSTRLLCESPNEDKDYCMNMISTWKEQKSYWG